MVPRTLWSLALGATVAVSATLPAQTPDSAPVTTTPIGSGVYLLQGTGGNIAASTGADGVILIDDDYAAHTPQLLSAVEQLRAGAIRFVINTHWHRDHAGGNASLAGRGALIVAHDNVRQRMSREQFIAAYKATIPPAAVAALPVITFTDTLTLYLNADTIQILHMAPAHTDGDAVIYFRHANVLHMGDTFFNRLYPFIDYSTGGTLDGMIAAADRGLALSDDATTIIPGHGPLATRADLRRYREMLAAVRIRILAARQKGLTLEQVLSAHLLDEFNDPWGKGFLTPEQFLTVAWMSLPPR
jgi:glyoxylase-like metal-dependent hydrolase (beta-lactamase superfamily II)